MNETFDPKARASTQWKTWLKEGTRLYGRAFSGWGMLMILVYVGMGYLETRNDLFGMLCLSFSGVMQLAHLTVMEQMRSGRVGVGDTSRALKTLWSEHRALLGRTILVRGMFTFTLTGLVWVFASVVSWIALSLSHASAPPPHPVEVESMWVTLWISCGHVWGVGMLPYFFQLGGMMSMVLPLLKEGMDLDMARRLDALALERNHTSIMRLRSLFLMGSLMCVFLLPPILPIVVVWWMAVIQCMYADVFERGSKIEAMAKVRREVHAPAFATVPVGH